MRDITAWSLVISLGAGFGACVPEVPSVGSIPAARDAASEPSPAWVAAPTGDAAWDAAAPVRGGDAVAFEVGATDDADARETAADVGVVPEAGADADGPSDAPIGRAPRAGEVVIDELLVDPAGSDLGHEWLELANLAAEPLDLRELHLADGASEVAVDAGVLAPGALLVLGQSADRAHNGDAPVDVAYGTRLALTNGADRVALCVGPCADGVMVDTFAWTAPFGDAYVGHAVVVERDGAICPATEAYGAGGNFGTPGRANPSCPDAPEPPADASADAGGGGDAGPDARD
jgi:Lamin Tail Domain